MNALRNLLSPTARKIAVRPVEIPTSGAGEGVPSLAESPAYAAAERAGRGHIARDLSNGDLIMLASQCQALPSIRRRLKVNFNIAASPRTVGPKRRTSR